MVEAGYRRVECDQSQAAKPVDPVLRLGVAFGVEELLRVLESLIVIAHYPDDLRAEALGCRLDQGSKSRISIRLSEIGQISGEDERFRLRPRVLKLTQGQTQVLVGCDFAVERTAAPEKVSIANVGDYVLRRRVLTKLSHEDSLFGLLSLLARKNPASFLLDNLTVELQLAESRAHGIDGKPGASGQFVDSSGSSGTQGVLESEGL